MAEDADDTKTVSTKNRRTPSKADAMALANESSAPQPLEVDGVLGSETIKRWQELTGQPVNGTSLDKNKDFVRSLQGRLAATVDHRVEMDGVLGPQTIGRLQSYLKVPVTQILDEPGSHTIKALQRRLNTGLF